MSLIKPIVHCEWDPGIFDFEIPVEIFNDGFFIYYTDSNTMKILWLLEPREILPGPSAHALANYAQYDYVLTWDQNILDSIPNAVYFRSNITWVLDYDVDTQKHFGVSNVAGAKRQTIGHRLRHELWARRNEITIPKTFFASLHGSPDGLNHELVLGDGTTTCRD